MRPEDAGEALDQRLEEAIARMGGGALHDRAQCGSLVETVERRKGVVHGGRARGAGRCAVY